MGYGCCESEAKMETCINISNKYFLCDLLIDNQGGGVVDYN